jgi:hypothetical protein
MSEQRTVDDAAEAPPAASVEVMNQLKALAQNVTQGNRISLDQSDAAIVQSDKSEDSREDMGASDPGQTPTQEPPISVFPRPTGPESGQTISDKSKLGKVFTLAGFVVAAVIGAGGTIAWQAHVKSDDVAAAAAPAPVAPAPIIAPHLGRQLEELAQDISSVRRGMEELAAKQQQLAAAQKQLDQLAAKQQQLAAKQEQVGQTIAKLQTLEQARHRTPAPVQTREAAVPARPSIPQPTSVEPAVQSPPPPPRTEAHPIPPLPVPMTR